MKTLKDVVPATLEQIRALYALKPPESSSGESKGHDKATDRKGRQRSSQRSELGKFHVDRYLDHYGIPYQVKKRPKDPRTFYTLSECLFDPSHRKDAAIVQDTAGMVTYFCFHNSCRGRTWADARARISREDSLAPYWPPPGHRAPVPPAPSKDQERAEEPWFAVTPQGRLRFNPALMANYIEEIYYPVVHEGKEFGNMFYKYDKGRGLWVYVPNSKISRQIRRILKDEARPQWIRDSEDLLIKQVYVDPDEFEYNAMWLNVRNGMLHLETGELRPHAPEYNSRVQLAVNYDPEAKCRRWEDALAEIFEDDLDKITTLQQFFGYCLYPRIVFPAALFQIGQGRNGKGLVESILCAMLGDENVCHISMKRLADRFGPAEIRNKLLNSCGETETGALDVTEFKQIATGDKVQADVKYQKDVIFTPIAKHMISMNSFPRIREKTDAFFRRIIVLEYKIKFDGDRDDKRLREKLLVELDGIFLWAFKGLKEVLKNDEIYQPESVEKAKKRFRERINPVLMFVDERCLLGPALMASPPELYKEYCTWCDDAKLQALGKHNFYEQIYLNYPDLTKERVGTKEMFIGIGLREE